MFVRATLCGAATGLVLAARALWQPPSLPASEALAVTLVSALAYAAAAGAVALVVGRVVPGGARGSPPGGALDEDARRALGIASAIVLGLLVATLRLRFLVGLGQMRLLPLVPGGLLEGAAAGLAGYWLLRRVPPRALAAAWRVVAAAALVAAVAATLAPALRGRLAAPPPPGARPSFLLVTVDTLRADRLGSYGNPDGLTPHLDQLAAQGVRFTRAIAPATRTGPSHLTMLTGLYPVNHGATRNGVPLRDDVETVVERLARSGYRTAGFVSAWPLSQAASGVASRFQHYDENLSARRWLPSAVERVPLLWLADRAAMFAVHWRGNVGRDGPFVGALDQRPGDRAVALALDWIARQRDRPYFAFVHLYEPHVPYAPPAEVARAVDPDYRGTLARHEHIFDPWAARAAFADPSVVQRIRKLYDAEVRVADGLVGRLLDGLARLGRDGDTVVLFTSDHGEGLGEHGEYFDHTELFYETTVHVPLVVRASRAARQGAVDDRMVRLADLTPTVLALAGLAPVAGLDGASLVPRLAGDAAAEPAFAHGSDDAGDPHQRVRHFVRTPRHKLIWTTDERFPLLRLPEAEELYDLEADPGELRPLLPVAAAGEVAAALRREMLAWLELGAGGGGGALDPETARRLRALGYL